MEVRGEKLHIFETGKSYKIAYKNLDYTKLVTGQIVGQDEFFVKVLDKFNDIIIVGKGFIIESKYISERIEKSEVRPSGDGE